MVPVAAAVAGLLVPAAIFWAFTAGLNVTDAFLIGALTLIGPRHPGRLRVFLLVLAVVDDTGALAAIAFVYTEDLSVGPCLRLSRRSVSAGARGAQRGQPRCGASALRSATSRVQPSRRRRGRRALRRPGEGRRRPARRPSAAPTAPPPGAATHAHLGSRRATRNTGGLRPRCRRRDHPPSGVRRPRMGRRHRQPRSSERPDTSPAATPSPRRGQEQGRTPTRKSELTTARTCGSS